MLAEKGEGQVTFKSVLTGESGETRPRLPGSAQIDEPTFAKGDQYKVKPAKNVRPVPKFSRREQLAKLATTTNHGAFNRNIANRLWALMIRAWSLARAARTAPKGRRMLGPLLRQGGDAPVVPSALVPALTLLDPPTGSPRSRWPSTPSARSAISVEDLHWRLL